MKFSDPDPSESHGADGLYGAPREGSSFFFKAYENLVPEIVRKTVLLGLGGVSMTEESVRRVLSEWRLPREEARRFLDFLIEQSQKSKGEILSLVGTEFKAFLRTLNLEGELRRLLMEMRIRIQADITFERREDGATAPEIDLRFSRPATRAQSVPSPEAQPSPAGGRKSPSGRRKPVRPPPADETESPS
jgi:polyhydroxyalkanoate synthesis regulator phasin